MTHRYDVPLQDRYAQYTDHILHEPIAARLINLPQCPECPHHIGNALKSPLMDQWVDYLYDAYNKMHRTGALSLSFPASSLPENTSIPSPRITCEVKITDSDNYYEIKCRLFADGSRMIFGIDYEVSYSPIIEGDTLLLMIELATSRRLIFYFLDISNAFKTNVIPGQAKRHHLHLPPLCMKWFKL